MQPASSKPRNPNKRKLIPHFPDQTQTTSMTLPQFEHVRLTPNSPLWETVVKLRHSTAHLPASHAPASALGIQTLDQPLAPLVIQ